MRFSLCQIRSFSAATFLFLVLASPSPVATAGVGRHYVFGHYMVCFATYGSDYEREIKEAEAAGIDG